MTTRHVLVGWTITLGLLLGLLGCDGVGSGPDEVKSNANDFRPSPKPASAIPDSLKQVQAGEQLTIPAEAVAEKPDSTEGDGPLRFDSVGVADTTLATVEKTNNDTEAVLDAAESSGTVTVVFRPAYGEFVSTEADSFSVTIVSNQPPTIETNEGLTVEEGGQKAITTSELLATDPDDDRSALTYTVTNGPTQGELLVNGSTASSFTQQDIENGNVEYNHTEENANNDSFTFDLCDGSGSEDCPSGETFQITVNESNQPPMAKDDDIMTDEDTETSEGAPGVLGNDTDPDEDDLEVARVNNSVVSVGTEIRLDSGAKLTLNADGSYTYDPNGQFEDLGEEDTGSDSFTYTASDGNGGTDQATVTVTINGVNDAPEIETNEGLTVEEGGQKTITTSELLATDPDDDRSALTYTVTNGPTRGELLVNGSTASSFTQADIENGNVEYNHTEENANNDSFTFDLCDGSGSEDCPSGETFQITVNEAD